MAAQIKFFKAAIGDKDVDRLLEKLDQQRFPKAALLLEIKNLYVTATKVFDDGCLAGVLICRGFRSYSGELCLEIDHLIAEDFIKRPFGDVLKESLFSWVRSAGFDRIFQHTHTPALARALRSVYGEAQEHIFSMNLTNWSPEIKV